MADLTRVNRVRHEETRGDSGTAGVDPDRPPVCNLPQARNPHWVAREALLEVLARALAADQSAAPRRVALVGVDGVGKTQLALEYAYRHMGGYNVIWWLRAAQPATLAADFADLAEPLALREARAPDQRFVADAVHNWLEHNAGWLLIFDDAADALTLQNYLPRKGAGHVLITSRNAEWQDTAQPLEVLVWSREEARDVLLRSAGAADAPAAETLADVLGGLPLALAQAAAYVVARGMSLAAYLPLYRAQRLALWGDEQAASSQNPADIVAITSALALERARAIAGAAELVYLCSFLAAEPISLALLREHAAGLPAPLDTLLADERGFRAALAALSRYALADVNDEALSLHALVQSVTRNRLPAEQRRLWAAAAAELMARAFPARVVNNATAWPTCMRLVGHALTAAEYAQRLDAAPTATALLYNQVGLYLRQRAEFAQARNCFQRALAIDEQKLGLEHLDVAMDANHLGLALYDLHDLPAARQHLERALAIREKALPLDHPHIATSANDLGRVLQALGDLSAARRCYERALAIREKALPPDHPHIATALNNLASALHDMGDLPTARQLFERALAIGEKTLPPDHPTIAIRLNNLARVLHDLGDFPAARQHFERALAIDEQAFGPHHPNIAVRLNNLGLVLRDLGDLDSARQHFERALAIGEKTLPPDHPSIATRLNNLGRVLHDLGDLVAARQHFERALAIDEQVFGTEHLTIARDVNNLGSVLRDLGNLPAARQHLERALAIREKALPLDHPDIATSANDLGRVLQALGDLSAARRCYERALAIREKALPPDHPHIATALNNLASALHDMGDLPSARQLFERALAIGEKTLPPDHPTIAIRLNNLARVLHDLGNLPAAQQLFERALAILEKTLPPDHPSIATTVNNLGKVLQDSGDFLAARQHFERTVVMLEKALPAEHPYLRGARASLEDLLRRMV